MSAENMRAEQANAGQHHPLIIDIAGTELTDVDRRRLAHPMTGGMILFARNWHSREQLVQLCADVKAVRSDLLIAVDHEGGRVQRFKTDGFTHVPAMAALGELWMQQQANEDAGVSDSALQACHAAQACGYVLAAELRACGVDFSFTPVLDLDWGNSGVIGDRAFHQRADIVSVLAQNVMHGLRQAGMRNCGKHFPGHGWVAADSHVAVPVDERTLDAILADDSVPYEHLALALDSVMPAHVIYPAVDALPAGFSKKWLQDVLRGEIGFTGAVFSDDLSMEGARQIGGKTVSYTEAAVAALNAGCDMVLLCNQSVDGGAPVDELLEGLSSALSAGAWQASVISEQRRLDLLPQNPPVAWDDLMVQPKYMQALDLLP